MLYPRSNQFRQVDDLSGFWQFCFDDTADSLKSGFDNGRFVAVPASWNELTAVVVTIVSFIIGLIWWKRCK
jgi:hypothetical protein